MTDSSTNIQINELICKSLDGEISPDERQILNDFVSKPENAAYYYKSLRLYEALKKHTNLFALSEGSLLDTNDYGLRDLALYEKVAPAVEIPKEEPELIQKVVYQPREKRKMSKLSVFTLVMSAAAMLFFVLLLKFTPVENQQHAVITDSFNTKWADASKPASIGSELSLYDGDRWLQGGFIKLLFGNGAEVVIESPARFEIISGSELNMLSGRVYSTVQERAKGFTINTPNSQVIDLGTEFGVEVLGGSSSVHMVKGKALVLPDNSLRTQKPIELSAGLAKKIAMNGVAIDIRVDDEKFVSDISSKMGMIYRADKAIYVGTWDNRLAVDLEEDLYTDGQLIQAVNLGPQSKPVTVCGVLFDPLTQNGTIVGGTEFEITKFKFYESSDNIQASLLSTGRRLRNIKGSSIRIHLKDLEIGATYRVQLIVGFPWHWCDVNCYGVRKEHMYFPNLIDQPRLGLATYRWKAQSSNERIELTSTRDKQNEVYIFGYVLHEINEDNHESL